MRISANLMSVVYFVYAAILVGGGAMGSRASGKSSSIMGSAAFAFVAIVAGFIARSNPRVGLIIGLIDALAVAGFFVYRFASTGKPFPAAPSIALSLVVLALSAIAYMGLQNAAANR